MYVRIFIQKGSQTPITTLQNSSKQTRKEQTMRELSTSSLNMNFAKALIKRLLRQVFISRVVTILSEPCLFF